MWKSLSIASKIMLCVGILCTGYLLSMIYVLIIGKDIEVRLTHISKTNFHATMTSLKVVALFGEEVRLYRDGVMLGEADYIAKAKQVSKDIINNLNYIKELPDLEQDSETRIKQISEHLKKYTQSANDIYIKMISNEHVDYPEIQKLAGLSLAIEKELKQFDLEFERNLEKGLYTVVRDIHDHTLLNMMLFFIVTGLSVFIMWLIIRRSIIRPLKRTVDVLKQVSLGDVSVRLKTGKDEIGEMGKALNAFVMSLEQKVKTASDIAEWNLDVDVEIASEKDRFGMALKTMVMSLNGIAAGLLESAHQVDQGSKQIAESGQELTRETVEQAASIQETTAAVETIGSQTQKNAEHAQEANRQTEDAFNAAMKGAERINEMVAAMQHISESTGKIEKINKTIDDIAFQINLLSINAAVEAARAGKHGKGFAVVAQEVRNLALKSGRAVQETSVLIKNAVLNVNQGNRIAQKTSDAFFDIHKHIAIAADLVSQIASSSHDQAYSINQVSDGLSQLVNSTQKNAAAAVQTAAAAEQLASQAAYVRSIMSRVRIKSGSKHVMQKELLTDTTRLSQPSPEPFRE